MPAKNMAIELLVHYVGGSKPLTDAEADELLVKYPADWSPVEVTLIKLASQVLREHE